MPQRLPRILILGAGAVGLSLAGKLAGVADVTVACRPVHADAILSEGLVMEGVWGDRQIDNLSCITGPQPGQSAFDYVFITSKGTDTESVCVSYAGMIKDRMTVSVQNGIGNEETIAAFTEMVIGGTITTNFSVVAPGHVRVKSQSAPLKLGIYPLETTAGRVNSAREQDLSDLIAIIRSAGIPAEKSDDIRSDIWAKSLLNIAVNPLTALLSVKVGECAEENLKEIIGHLIEEAYRVIDAEGITLRWATAPEYLAYLYEVQVPDFAGVFTSMYFDVRQQRQTEIDLLNGMIVDLGDKHGIPTPFNRCITLLVRYTQKYR